ncbi:MAG: hypothetical protein QNK37_10760 [Acidobacteriota bacterium]|nr:hypothetical protein [Acidobacteriota bacterium]
MSESKNPLLRIDSFRLTLAVYFFLYAYIVARSLVPLPDEPPRINFWGVFCVTGGVVIGYHCLTSSFRLFLVGIWLFIPIGYWQLGKKIKFLEMMLEPKTIQVVTQYSLGIVLFVLLMPKAFRTFHKGVSEYRRSDLLFLKKGVRY